MVFRSDATRRVANSLLTLFDQVDAAFPGRDKRNDGTIGDVNHQATNSDHNANPEGVICALDITHDPAHGFDADQFAETLRLNRDQRIKYVIRSGRIFSSTNSPWTWRDRNKGPGDHTEHVHISVGRGPDGHSTNPELYDSTLPWAIDSLQTPSAPSSPPLASGKGSWYSQFSGKYEWIDTGDEPGSAALGCPDDAQGISFYDHATLGDWFEVHYPNGFISIEQQTDIGPNPKTGRKIDISAAAAERAGYTPRNFPTDSIISWRPVAAPAVVANLPPPQQATRYRDLRSEKPMAEQTDVVTIAKSIQDLAAAIAALRADFAPIKMEVATLRSLVTGEKPPDPPVKTETKPPLATAPSAPQPGPVAATVQSTSMQLSTIAGVAIWALQAFGVIPPGIGEAATQLGAVLTAAPVGSAAISATGGWGLIQNLFNRVTGRKTT